MRGTPAIELAAVSKRFGRQEALRRVDFSISPGEVVGFVGLNGAGKTTTLRLIAGLLSPSAGQVSLFGKPARAWERARAVGTQIDRPAFYPHVSARNSLRMFGTLTGRSGRSLDEAVDRALAAFGATAFADTRTGQLSTGMRQRLGLALAFMGQPDLVVLDEPSDGLDPEGIAALREEILAKAAGGTTVFFSSHILAEVETVTSRVIIIHEGQILADRATRALGSNSATRVVLRTEDELERAEECLASEGFLFARISGPAPTLLVDHGDSRAVSEALWSNGIGASEISLQTATLEESFLKLVGLREHGK